MDKAEKRNRAFDLMLEDLHTKNFYIRIKAKQYNCEEDLDYLKEKLISHLNKIK